MTLDLVIREEAIGDMVEAALWYENHLSSLGDKFIEEVEKTLAIIKSNPHSFQVQKKSLRHGYVNRFPYIIIYEIGVRNIVVYAVIRTQRNPKKRYIRTRSK